MRVADFIAEYVAKVSGGIVFMVSGGGMMYLSDGIAKHPTLQAISCHHEQAAAMAAVGYAKQRNGLGVCYVTTGCGGTNAMTGLLNAWQDSTPVLFISGQVPVRQTIRGTGHNVRQIGTQEADIIGLVEPITKFAAMVRDPKDIVYFLDKAVALATTGRPGPTWLDIPMDVAEAEIDPFTQIRYLPDKKNYAIEWGESGHVYRVINTAERPVILVGSGIRKGNAIELFHQFVEKYKLPIVTTFMAADIIPTDSPYYIGRVGMKGNWAANKAILEADAVVTIGSRLSLNSTGYVGADWAPHARHTIIDIDNVEHHKGTVRVDDFILADARLFFERFLGLFAPEPKTEWLNRCQEWKHKHPVYGPGEAEGIDVYAFLAGLAEAMPDDATVVADAGSAFYATARGLAVKDGQRVILSGGQAEMGFTLPATVGACCARQGKQVIGITGDGSFQMNIQELQTVKHHNLPIKLFVWNNDGYLSIRATQDKYCDGRHIGTDQASGVSFPDVRKIASAYGIRYVKLVQPDDIGKWIRKILEMEGPVVCEVMCKRDQVIVPKENDDADEEREAAKVDVEKQAGDGREVGEGNPQGQEAA